jgi:hypothetical protein
MVDCSHVFGLFVGEITPRPSWKFADRLPIRRTD